MSFTDEEVYKVARLICHQMQDDDCTCASACGASINAARAIIPLVAAHERERIGAVLLQVSGDPGSTTPESGLPMRRGDAHDAS